MTEGRDDGEKAGGSQSELAGQDAVGQRSARWRWIGGVGAALVAAVVILVMQHGDPGEAPVDESPGVTAASGGDTAVSDIKPEIIGWDYSFNDIGDGWALGTLRLAFVNRTTQPATYEPFTISGGHVETEEGREYAAVTTSLADWEGSLGRSLADVAKSGDLVGLSSPAEVVLTSLERYADLPMPVDIYVARTGGSGFQGDPFAGIRSEVDVAFVAAATAHPTVLTLELEDGSLSTIDLRSLPTSLPEPSAARTRAADIASFAANWSTSTDEWTITFEPQCIVDIGGYGELVNIPYTVTNLDDLGGTEASMVMPHATYRADGLLFFEDDYTLEHSLGPGQSLDAAFYLLASDGELLFMYDENRLVGSYLLDCVGD